MSEIAETRVARGVALLDEKVPGWERQINLAVLDIRSCSDCVIGQVDCDPALNAALALVPPGRDWLIWFGFDAPPGDHRDEEYEALRNAWVDTIKSRFDSGSLSDCEQP